ncbi:Protein MIZU-KUSSEI 1 [Hibiscus syriacus]|uniref:Protein MIZU-KUSSEI 1 n=1 Tax=Hibiscus syriacus TaxID=106335 RepID=A0A6A3AU19_HIBSY|nr:protein MIZU-KUSSEI 1-like [Hibiscus syriacus]KAE8707388.1 Protein MIZU-KUSSEI 1 [Hibiscus syriacus]
MKTITAKSPHDSSFSFSRRYFNWKKKVEDDDNEEEILNFSSSSHFCDDELRPRQVSLAPAPTKKLAIVSVSKLRSALRVFCKNRSGLGTKVIGTMFGYRRDHVHFAFQEDAKQSPAFLIQLATPTSVLVKEMASGLVRITLECEKKTGKKGVQLLDEPVWKTYCNGKKYGFATRRQCGPEDWKVLKAVEHISMGAGVLPGSCKRNGGGPEGEVMYMRARFERVVGSKDSEAFYMMNPDDSGGPELSVYLIRV